MTSTPFTLSPSKGPAPLDRWIIRITTATLLALAAGLLGVGIAFYV